MSKHVPVLVEEVLSNLNLQPGQVVVDATLGAGGYGREILTRISPKGLLIAVDRDTQAINAFREYLQGNKITSDVRLRHSNFSDIKDELQVERVHQVDAIVADLGLSSDQLEDGTRGLSFLKDGPLDMRLDRSEATNTAAQIVNTYSEEAMIKLFLDLAQEPHARSIVRGILSERKKRPFTRTGQLVSCIEKNVPKRYQMNKIHCATRVFMALRMQVNHEIESLKTFLDAGLAVLVPGGRMAIVTFHSGEDRIVKEFIRENARGCICPDEFPLCRCDQVPKCIRVHSKPIMPTDEEKERNPRSRSAKLRLLEKVGTEKTK